MEINFDGMNAHQKYNFMMGTVVPRPIAWVSTMSRAGKLNLAPFSSFNVVNFEPPVVLFSPTFKSIEENGEKKIVMKDTQRNIMETLEFVVNLVSFDLMEKMEKTSHPVPYDVDEFELAGLTPEPSKYVKVPRVKESKVSFECRLRQVINFGPQDLAGNLILGDVITAHIVDGLWQDNHIDPELLAPVGRLEGVNYCKITAENRFKLGTHILEKAK